MPLSNDCGVVIGTTGLNEQEKASISGLSSSQGGRIVLAPNMSVGVNLLFLLCQQAATILGKEFDVEIVEMHHRHKKDWAGRQVIRLFLLLWSSVQDKLPVPLIFFL